MRSFFLSILCLFSLGTVFSQAPEKFTYQSIIRGESGLILKSTELGIKLSVLKNSRTGTVVYSEVHSTSSNKNGLVTFLIGDGTSSDIFSDIDWSTGEYFLKVEVDPMGGIDYSIEQTSQLLSVPYALYASRTSNVDLDKDVEGILPVSRGGTGSPVAPMIAVVTAPDAKTARAILGIDNSGGGGSGSGGTKLILSTVADNYLSIKDSATNDDEQELTAGTVPLTLGGTGATDAPGARTNLGLGSIATQNNDAIDVDGGAIDGTIIGANTPSTGVFTSVNSGLVQSVGDTDIIIKTGNDTTGTITLANGADGNINISPNGTGKVVSDNTDLTGTTRLAGTTITASGVELNALDGDNTAQSITVESADRVVINDDGTMKQIAVSTVGAFLISSLNLQLNSLTDVVDSGEASNFGNSLLIGTGSYSGSGSTDNTGVGTQALDALTTGDDNTALGYNALTANTEGSDNIGIGQNALKANTTGNFNIALGSDALSANISGNNNLSIGLNSLKTGNYVDGSNDFSNNVTLGNFALELTTTGSDNTSIGYRTGDNNTTGKSNVFIGSNAGDTNTIGEENVIIGTDADTGAINAINRIVIGDDASGSVDNTAVIGNNSVTDVYMSQDSGATIHADGVKFYEDTANGTNYVGFNSAASLAGNQVWTLPTADGSANQVLKTDGNGILSWNSDSDSGSLVQITENSKTGYRLSGVDPANYADIGTDAVDLSYSETSSSFNGAKGNYSFAVGFETMALGYKSFAAGSKVTASGNLSTAFGDQTTAGAVNATTFGTGTTAKDFSSFIIGTYNSVGSTTTANGSLSSYDSDNSAFVIGNGADSSNKSDAFVVYSNGNTAIAGTLTLGGAFTVPASIGSSGQVLKVGSGTTLEWGSAGGGAGGINDLSDAEISGHANSQLNSSIGIGTLMGSGSGPRNTALGIGALSSQSGDGGWSQAINNTAVGYNALNSLTTGVQNTIIGAENSGNLTGDKNVVLGAQAGLNLSTADRNTIIGYRSVEQLTTGDYNTIIGNEAAQSTADAQNQIVIGSTATGQGNNYAVIGNASVSRLYAAQDGAAVIYANGTINSSDLRFKTIIKPVELGLQFIKKLNPVSYYKISKSQYKGEEDNNEPRYEYGLIAQEVEDILKESDPNNSIIIKDDEGFYGMDYKQITMPLIKAVQEQEKTIETLKKVNEDLVQRLEAIEKLLLK